MNPYLVILTMFAIALSLSGGIIVLSTWLGPKRPTKSKLSPYECGLEPVGNARERFSVKFYLVAILFIIFDIEVVFMYPWAIRYKHALENGEGLRMLAVMGGFFLTLSLGLLFEIRKGVIDWSEKKK